VRWAICSTLRERAPSAIVHQAYVRYGGAERPWTEPIPSPTCSAAVENGPDRRSTTRAAPPRPTSDLQGSVDDAGRGGEWSTRSANPRRESCWRSSSGSDADRGLTDRSATRPPDGSPTSSSDPSGARLAAASVTTIQQVYCPSVQFEEGVVVERIQGGALLGQARRLLEPGPVCADSEPVDIVLVGELVESFSGPVPLAARLNIVHHHLAAGL
jgi:hypothetical protein